MVLVLHSLIPNVIPIVIRYGAVGKLNVVGTIAGSISIGIIIDDTNHFLRFRAAARQPGVTVEAAMRSTVAHVRADAVSLSDDEPPGAVRAHRWSRSAG